MHLCSRRTSRLRILKGLRSNVLNLQMSSILSNLHPASYSMYVILFVAMDATIIIQYSQTSLIRSSVIRIPRHSAENRWLPIYSICHAYIQCVCVCVSDYPVPQPIRMFFCGKGICVFCGKGMCVFCGKGMCAVKRGLTVHVSSRCFMYMSMIPSRTEVATY